MKIIGVCGNSGSGKSTYCKKLCREHGALLIDVDKIVHEILEIPRVKNSICALIGTSSFLQDEKINRKLLGNILFSDKKILGEYNQMIYKEIEFVIDRMIFAAEGGGVDVIIDWALLPITKYYQRCDEKHLVKKHVDDRRVAVLGRDGIDEEYFEKREKSALSYKEEEFDKIINLEFKKKAMFAGTFDPFTIGHLDIVEQAYKDFESIIIGIAINPDKMRRFDKDSMQYAITQVMIEKELKNIECVVYSGFTGAKALELDCYTLIRGLRSEEDKLYEQRIADYNKQHFGLNTVYYYSPEKLKDISSTKIKELMKLNLSIDKYVPKAVLDLVQ